MNQHFSSADTAPGTSDRELAEAAQRVADLLIRRGAVLATAESCTGGWIAKILTDIAGSSAWFEGGAVTYSNSLKRNLLGVEAATLERCGAVSRETVVEMVVGARRRFAASVAVAVTGIAGPAGGSPDKPVGTVWIGWQHGEDNVHAEGFRFDGGRDAVRRQTVFVALQGIEKILTR
ncbi:CinA family protein [Rudaea sp.]|uniref:CinA family protein n=1 Tax=Rudaea sp. TaxID=2136325 RepID=UPI00321FFCA8